MQPAVAHFSPYSPTHLPPERLGSIPVLRLSDFSGASIIRDLLNSGLGVTRDRAYNETDNGFTVPRVLEARTFGTFTTRRTGHTGPRVWGPLHNITPYRLPTVPALHKLLSYFSFLQPSSSIQLTVVVVVVVVVVPPHRNKPHAYGFARSGF